MKIFLAYKFTGENPISLQEANTRIIAALSKAGHSVWNNLQFQSHYEQNGLSNKEIMEQALIELNKADAILAYVSSEERSEGMLVEIGFALARGKKFILALKRDVKTTSLAEMCDELIEFSTFDELSHKLEFIR